MSRQTGECYAEVLFESQAGRFRCHWEQRRARKKADGNLQDQEHQIADADIGKSVETKKSLVGAVIEEKTGMDFDRFTRSILLAQGGFDTFLKADVEEKSKILEQITGTGIYSDISRRVHERQRDEREKLKLLHAETSGIVILDPEQEQAIQQDLAVKRKQELDLTNTATETGKAIAWLTGIDDLKKEIDALSAEAAKIVADTETFKPKRVRLEQAVKASSLDGAYATLTAIRKQQADDKAALKTEEAALPALQAAAHAQARALTAAEQFTRRVKQDLQAAAPLLRKIRSLDQKVDDQAKALSDDAESCAREGTTIAANRVAREKEQERRTTAQKALETVKKYLKEHVRDEWLIGGLAGIEEQFDNLLARQKEIGDKEAALKNADTTMAKAAKKLEASTKHVSVCKQESEQAATCLQHSKNAFSELLGGKVLHEYRTEKEALLREMAYIKKIEELEDHRARLEDGKPCPLCGATQHPFAKGNVPVPDEIEHTIVSLTNLIARVEEQETSIRLLEQKETTARTHLNESEKQHANAVNEKMAAEKARHEAKDSLMKLRSDFSDRKLAAAAKLQPLGITDIPESDVSSLLDSLKSRLAAWQEQVKQKTEIEKHLTAIDSELKQRDAVIDTQARSLAEKQEHLEQLKKNHADATDERKKLYGDKKPDAEESRLNKTMTDAENAEKNARSLNTELQQKLTTANTHVALLKKRIEQREPDLDKAEIDFSATLTTAGFTDEHLFIEARLPTTEREFLAGRAKELDNAITDLKARQKDRLTRLAVENAKKLTDKTLEDLKPRFRDYEDSLLELREAIAALKHKLNENSAARERIKEKQTAIAAQNKECRRWEKLHSLIGSADGKKYRTFAQGLTFELMVSHANRQLGKLTDRYLLIRDEQQPLELNVVDNYQAGEIRSTRNLSGGESFIVSLALALGLSKMASRKVRVDSLFLDEGFGTLDENSLETALETLSGIHQDGKLIGIISHVSALKERISTQISITPVSEGRSALFGPGCRRGWDAGKTTADDAACNMDF